MKYRHLGKAGIKVSELSLGSWVTFHNQAGIGSVVNMMAAAYDAGVNFFDNAEVYAKGESERVMGAALKKLGATNIPGIEEVNLFKEDGKVIHFVNPKVQASIGANTYIVSGLGETKSLQELLPSIVSQLGMDNIAQLQAAMTGAQGMGGAGGPSTIKEGDEDEEDDDVPDLVDGNFEEVSEK